MAKISFTMPGKESTNCWGKFHANLTIELDTWAYKEESTCDGKFKRAKILSLRHLSFQKWIFRQEPIIELELSQRICIKWRVEDQIAYFTYCKWLFCKKRVLKTTTQSSLEDKIIHLSLSIEVSLRSLNECRPNPFLPRRANFSPRNCD